MEKRGKLFILCLVVSTCLVEIKADSLQTIAGEMSSSGFATNLQCRISGLLEKETNVESKVTLQTNIWRLVLGCRVSSSSPNYARQFSDLTEAVAFLTTFRSCTQNRDCLNILADHLGRITYVSISEHDKLCRDAYERDRDLRFGNGPRTRSAGSQGHMGPNMKAWNDKRHRIQNWNRLVGEYRKVVLSLMASSLRQFAEGLEAPLKAAFKSNFTNQANMTREESDFVFGSAL